jgi:hypothetical protein
LDKIDKIYGTFPDTLKADGSDPPFLEADSQENEYLAEVLRPLLNLTSHNQDWKRAHVNGGSFNARSNTYATVRSHAVKLSLLRFKGNEKKLEAIPTTVPQALLQTGDNPKSDILINDKTKTTALTSSRTKVKTRWVTKRRR